MLMDDVIVATGISLLSSFPSDTGVDYASLFQPIVDGCFSAIAKMLPIIIPIFAVPFLIDVVLYVVRLISDRKAAEIDAAVADFESENYYLAHPDEDPELYYMISSYRSDEELSAFYSELSAIGDFEDDE